MLRFYLKLGAIAIKVTIACTPLVLQISIYECHHLDQKVKNNQLAPLVNWSYLSFIKIKTQFDNYNILYILKTFWTLNIIQIKSPEMLILSTFPWIRKPHHQMSWWNNLRVISSFNPYRYVIMTRVTFSLDDCYSLVFFIL